MSELKLISLQDEEPASEARNVHDERVFNYLNAFIVLTIINLISPIIGVALIIYFIKSGWWLGIVYVVSGCIGFGVLRWATLGDAKDLPQIQLRICFMTYAQLVVLGGLSVVFAVTPRAEFGLCCPTSDLSPCCDDAEFASHVWAWSGYFVVLVGLLPSAIVIHSWASKQEIVKFTTGDLSAEPD